MSKGPRGQVTLHSHTCENCGADFQNRRRAQKYCSRQCANEARQGKGPYWFSEQTKLIPPQGTEVQALLRVWGRGCAA